jgi:hypothetical protein
MDVCSGASQADDDGLRKSEITGECGSSMKNTAAEENM